MSYNYRKEYAKWKRWKDQEERILKQMKMPKNKINELREFDWAQFNDERRFTRKQNITNDQYFALIPRFFNKGNIKINKYANQYNLQKNRKN